MAEDTARAIGAEGTERIKIAGREYNARPLGIKELGELERICLEVYKNRFLKTYSDNLHLFEDKEKAEKLRAEKFEEAARWDISDLPPKYVYDPSGIILNDRLKKWAFENLSIDQKDSRGEPLSEESLNRNILIQIIVALDAQILSDELYENLTGGIPKKIKTNYVSWWITGSFGGMIEMNWVCFKKYGITREELEDALVVAGTNQVANLARSIERLSAPAVGNG